MALLKMELLARVQAASGKVGISMHKPTPAQLDQIFKNTHADFKGVLPDGTRTILVCRGATCIVALDDLTPDEVEQRLAQRKR